MVHATERIDLLVLSLKSATAADLEVENAARERLRSSTYLELRRITCSVADKILYLRGVVSSYYLRQIAHTVLRDLDGVEVIENCLEVVSRPQSKQ